MMKLPLQSIRYLLICAVGLFGMLLFVVFPYHRALQRATAQGDELRVQLEEQRSLYPLFVRYLNELRRAPPEGLDMLPVQHLSRDAASNVYGLLQDLAGPFDLTVTELMPDPETLFNADDRFMVDVAMVGPFASLQPFLRQVSGLPYLAHIERVQLRPVEGQRELRLRLWLLREKPPGPKGGGIAGRLGAPAATAGTRRS